METIFEQSRRFSSYKLEANDCKDQKRILFRASHKRFLRKPQVNGFVVQYSKIGELAKSLADFLRDGSKALNVGCPPWAASNVLSYILPRQSALEDKKLSSVKAALRTQEAALNSQRERLAAEKVILEKTRKGMAENTGRLAAALDHKSAEVARLSSALSIINKAVSEAAAMSVATEEAARQTPLNRDDEYNRAAMLEFLNTHPAVSCAFFDGENKIRVIPYKREEAAGLLATLQRTHTKFQITLE